MECQAKTEMKGEYSLDEKEFSIIRQYLINNFPIEDVMEKIDPRLKAAYDNRSIHYLNLMKEKNESENDNKGVSVVKIPRDKMNHEERLLTASLSETNMRDDINAILECFSNVCDLVYQTNRGKEDLLNRYEEKVLGMVIDAGLKSFYASKVKLHSQELDEEEEKNGEVKKEHE